jgi:DNA polymerase-3 subunit gamma/tau
MWPNILEAVKNRRRLTWMLLSNNAQVSGFDGETLQIGFDNPGARNSFANNGSEDVLKQAISDALGVQWKIEAIVDPSGGGPSGGSAGGYGGGGGGYGGGGGFGGSPRPPQGGGPAASAFQGQPQAQGPSGAVQNGAQSPYGFAPGGGPAQGAAGSAPGGPGGTGSGAGAAAMAAATSRAQVASGRAAPPAPRAESHGAPPPAMEEPPPLEDDIPEDDDPDLVGSALSGHDLFIRELGATVIEEINHG